jgi:cytochrome c-type biogenesis protein
MLDSIFLTVNAWMTHQSSIAALGCFAWGMISVIFSPCHLASIPLIVAYVGGQNRTLAPREAGTYAALFTLGLFMTIALIGAVCAVLGRMLGDVNIFWQVPVGAALVWVALGMFGVEACSVSGRSMERFNLRGKTGAWVLGLLYGVLSGSCTFGFIAPILAIITVQAKIATGLLYVFLFALGHCLPIAVAGSSAAAVRKVLENRLWQGTGTWFRRTAGVFICLMGGYFILTPFLSVWG